MVKRNEKAEIDVAVEDRHLELNLFVLSEKYSWETKEILYHGWFKSGRHLMTNATFLGEFTHIMPLMISCEKDLDDLVVLFMATDTHI